MKGMTPETAYNIYSAGSENKLKKLRVSKGYSQQGLSDASGVAKRAIQTYEQGEKQIDKAQLVTICQLAKTLECKIEDILESEELIELFRACK